MSRQVVFLAHTGLDRTYPPPNFLKTTLYQKPGSVYLFRRVLKYVWITGNNEELLRGMLTKRRVTQRDANKTGVNA